MLLQRVFGSGPQKKHSICDKKRRAQTRRIEGQEHVQTICLVILEYETGRGTAVLSSMSVLAGGKRGGTTCVCRTQPAAAAAVCRVCMQVATQTHCDGGALHGCCQSLCLHVEHTSQHMKKSHSQGRPHCILKCLYKAERLRKGGRREYGGILWVKNSYGLPENVATEVLGYLVVLCF